MENILEDADDNLAVGHLKRGMSFRRWNFRRKKYLVIVVCVLFLLVFCMFGLASLGDYLKKTIFFDVKTCYRDEEELMTLRKMVHVWDDLTRKANVTAWIDFGTLLGAVRNHDVLPHDRDIDVGILAKDMATLRKAMKKEFFEKGFDLRPVRYAFFPLGQIFPEGDILLWHSVGRKLVFEGRGRETPEVLVLTLYYNLPSAAVFPLEEIEFAGKMVRCPRNPSQFIRLRYPHTWWFKLPYNPHCWFPQLMRS